MADFDLTQTDAQVQSILNDAQGAMGAGAQTSLTTDYIMLKDTSGNYHKILKDSFTEACRNVLAGLLVNNDKGTTISQIAAIASGDFGSVTPANLASVLGGLYVYNGNGLDANSIEVTGAYVISANTANLPSIGGFTGGWGVLVHIQSNYRLQIYAGGSATDYGYFIRFRTGTDWHPWYRISGTEQ